MMTLLKALRLTNAAKFTQASIAVIVGALAPLGTSTVSAYVVPVPQANVVLIEASYVPDLFFFQIDATAANCPPGTWLLWQGGILFPKGTADDSSRKASVRSMFQAVLAQKTTGSKVSVYATATTPGQTCIVEYLHLL